MKRSGTIKSPVGTLSDRTVLPQARWKGLAPTSSSLSYTFPAGFGAGTPQQEHLGSSQGLEKRSPGWPLLHPETRTIGFGRWFFVLLALCGMVWYTQLRSTTRCLSKRQIHNHISHFGVLVPKDRMHLIQVLRIFHVQKDYTQLVAEFPRNPCG